MGFLAYSDAFQARNITNERFFKDKDVLQFTINCCIQNCIFFSKTIWKLDKMFKTISISFFEIDGVYSFIIWNFVFVGWEISWYGTYFSEDNHSLEVVVENFLAKNTLNKNTLKNLWTNWLICQHLCLQICKFHNFSYEEKYIILSTRWQTCQNVEKYLSTLWNS